MNDKERCVFEEKEVVMSKNPKVKMKWTHLTVRQDRTAKGIFLQSDRPKRRV